MNFLQFVGLNSNRNGIVVLNQERLVIEFAKRKYVWESVNLQKLISVIDGCSIYEISINNMYYVDITRKLLYETFKNSHKPPFNHNFFIDLIKSRIDNKCQTLSIIKNNQALSTVGYEIREFNLNYCKKTKFPFLSDGATDLKYRKKGLITLLNLVVFTRAIEDNVCPIIKNRYIFCVKPTFKLQGRKNNNNNNLNELNLPNLSPSFKTILSIQNIKGIEKICFGNLEESKHMPKYLTITLILYLNPKIEKVLQDE